MKLINLSMRRKLIGILVMVLLFGIALWLAISSAVSINQPLGEIQFEGTQPFYRLSTAEEEDYSQDNKVCRVEYQSADQRYLCAVNYSYEEWAASTDSDREITGYIYTSENTGAYAAFSHEAQEQEIVSAMRNALTDGEYSALNTALAIALVAIGVGILNFGWTFFTAYEKSWFLGILVLAAIFGILFPEEDCNGISGILIMALYLADTLLNILCELLISKQSKWNFIVSVFVEITEIAICLVLSYRFATMATTLFFWLPIDIISFINWHKHPDRQEEELTQVRRLRGWQEVLVLVGIAVWTLGIGYLLTTLDFGTDLFNGNETLEVVVCYIDACVSAVGIANGLFIFFRFREQWVAWIACAVLETVINILSGQYVLLVLKAGYLSNSIYGYVRWSRYIKRHPEIEGQKSVF